MAQYYPRGNWWVQTPIWTVDAEGEPLSEDQVIAKMICPHPSWTVQESGPAMDREDPSKPVIDPETGQGVWQVVETCPLCGAIRFRWIPESMKDEPFDYSVPQTGPWYERLYNLGNFTILSRRYRENENVDPNYMTRVETPAGHAHTGMIMLGTWLFSPAALDQIGDMERMLKMGPQRYVKFRSLKEGRNRRDQIKELEDHATTLAQVVQDIGPESIAAARAIFEAEVDQEAAELEELRIQEMEREVAQRKREAAERKSKKKPK